MKEPEFDVHAAHRYFSAYCFNTAWGLIDKAERSAEEDEAMLRLSLAATWHWTQREDCTPKNLSISFWQTSRIYALLRQADNARRYAQLCLQASQIDGVPPFYLGYAYEALARAEAVAGKRGAMAEYLKLARGAAEQVSDPEAKQQLLADLDTIT